MSEVPKTIIFFSLHYPFHFTDSYLDEEINLLAKQFEKVVVISANTFTSERRTTPPNVVVFRFQPKVDTRLRIQSLSLFFQGFFYKEIFRALFTYKVKLTVAMTKELFAFYARSLATQFFLKQTIAEQNIDTKGLLVYTYWMVESTMASVLFKKANHELKIISKAHSQDVYFERSPVKYHPYRKFIFDSLNRVFFISDDAKKYFIEKQQLSGQEQTRILIGRIGINSANQNYIAAKDDGVLRIISVAYIQKIKRIDLIVDALALLTDVKVEWYHAGHSNQSERDFEEIKKYASAKLSKYSNISFYFLGKTGKRDLFNLYHTKKFDIFLNVSETEGIPVSMMESMSYSVPVIGTNVGGVAEIVEDGENGFLLSPYPDAKEVLGAILKFQKLDTEEKERMRRVAFDTWNEKYNATKNYSNLAKEILYI